MKALLIGSTGLIAKELIPKLIEAHFEVIGVSNTNEPETNICNYKYDLYSNEFKSLLEKSNFNLILNALHSDDYEKSLKLNEQLSIFSLEQHIRYVYFSSSNALDADTSRERSESEVAGARSEYGQYKAACEDYLNLNHKSSLILRFSSILGQYRNGISIVENALKELKITGRYECSQGIVGNSITASQLTSIIVNLVVDKQTGTFHIGADKGFEGLDFFQDMAVKYGYSKDSIIAGKQYTYNSTVVPNKIYGLYENKYKFSRSDVLDGIVNIEELKKYQKFAETT